MVARLSARWLSIPASIREPLRSFAVSVLLGIPTAVGTLYSAYFLDPLHPHTSWAGFFTYLESPVSIGAVFAACAGVYRARQAHKAATETVVTASTVSLPQPTPPDRIVAVSTTIADPTKAEG